MAEALQARDLKLAVSGDFHALGLIEAASHERVQLARAELPVLLLTAEDISRVLRHLRSRSVAPEQAQRWASFVRRGYVPGRAAGAVQPIDIEYQAQAEDAIVEALSRLDELGEKVDGTISNAEIDDLLSALESASTESIPTPT